MCGIMLKHHGYNVTILEQEVSPSRQGYDAGIKIGPAVEAFLNKHDRVKRDMTIICPPGFMINMEGKPKAQRGQTMVTTSWGLIISVLRANFDGFTSAAVPIAPELKPSDGKATFRSGARATSINEVGDQAEVKLLNVESGMTETLKAGIVIVADGSNSGIRNTLLPDVKREYLGYMCWRGTVREENIDDQWNELYAEKATLHLMDKTYLLKSVSARYRNRITSLTYFIVIPSRQTTAFSTRASVCIIGFGTRTFQQTHPIWRVFLPTSTASYIVALYRVALSVQNCGRNKRRSQRRCSQKGSLLLFRKRRRHSLLKYSTQRVPRHPFLRENCSSLAMRRLRFDPI
jgi:2-polyprenyl-6-methoxyphenol hydroxylase-like FAD-dependent oxidoreductase